MAVLLALMASLMSMEVPFFAKLLPTYGTFDVNGIMRWSEILLNRDSSLSMRSTREQRKLDDQKPCSKHRAIVNRLAIRLRAAAQANTTPFPH